MSTAERTVQGRGWLARAAAWAPGLLVALGAVVATVHGLYEVAHDAGVPGGIAWLYPLITDGLALVAYASTSRLTGSAQFYAWTVVVLSAGLSGLAQASYLAGGVSMTAPSGSEPPQMDAALKFGVGAWPAVAAAIVAHLLFLLAHTSAHGGTASPAPGEPRPGPESPVPSTTQPPSVDEGRAAVRPSPVQHPPVQRPAVQAARVQRALPSRSVQHDAGPGEHSGVQTSGSGDQRARARDASPALDTARSAAQRHAAEHGDLPTVSVLMDIAEVSRGTAGNALKQLREQRPSKPTELHVVHDTDDRKAQP